MTGDTNTEKDLSMKYQAVLFDLDGTLLPQDQDVFIQTYFGLLTKTMAKYGYDPQKLMKAVWAGTNDMVANDGADTNEAVFWKRFAGIFGESALKDVPLFDDFYRTAFQDVQAVCSVHPGVPALIKDLKACGYRLALASNPVFPRVATEARMRWAGVSPEDFEVITTYENICFCKPNLRYYRCVAEKMHISPEQCLMVGNDVGDDMPARDIGMGVFLVTDCLINHENAPVDQYPHGGINDLRHYLLSTEV